MTIPDIKQEPIIVKNNWVNFRQNDETIPFYIDYIAQCCVEGWDEKGQELFMYNLEDMVKNNHQYKDYEKGEKILFPFRECMYVGWEVKQDGNISECIDEESKVMFRVPTNLLINLKQYKDQPVVKFFDAGHFNVDGKKFFNWDEKEERKGRIINFYKEKGEMVYIALTSEHGSICKLKKEDFVSLNTYHKVNSNYRYGEETDKVTKYG